MENVAIVTHPDTDEKVTIQKSEDGQFSFNNGIRYETANEAIDAAKAYLSLISED